MKDARLKFDNVANCKGWNQKLTVHVHNEMFKLHFLGNIICFFIFEFIFQMTLASIIFTLSFVITVHSKGTEWN